MDVPKPAAALPCRLEVDVQLVAPSSADFAPVAVQADLHAVDPSDPQPRDARAAAAARGAEGTATTGCPRAPAASPTVRLWAPAALRRRGPTA